jgi:dihydrofolate reductase
MRKVILGLAISLDGFIEGPNGEYDWCFTDQDYGLSDFFKRVDTLFMGRKTYELMLSVGDKASPGFPKMKEYIFSTTLEKVKEGAALINGDIKQEIDRIKKEKGKDIWLFGGASLTTALMNLNMVDELWLSVHPILLGSGKPLFQNITHRIQLELLETKSYSSGLVSLKYAIKK